MKQIVLSRLLAGLALVLAFFATHPAWAQTAEDDAAQSVYTNGWFSGTNGGSGFGPWLLLSTTNDSTDFSGFLIQSSGVTAVDTNSKSFAMYANGDNTDAAVAYRNFLAPLAVGQVFSLKFANQGVANNGVVGFSLGSSANGFGPALTFGTITSNARFSFYFVGGDLDYTIYDGNLNYLTTVPFTEGGMTLQFTLVDANDYSLTVKSADGSTTVTNYVDQPLQNSGSIDTFACYNLQTSSGQNDYFNQFTVLPVSLLPPTIQNVQPTNNSYYLPTSQAITFTAASSVLSGIGIKTNGVTVSLNGTNVTGLTFSGSSTNWSVIASPVLAPNVIYNGVITVTDSNNNQAVSTFTFDTWSATDMYIQASDYNYSSGHYIPSPYLGEYSIITAPAVSNVDYYLATPNPTNTSGYANNYRPQDPIWLEPSGDTLDHDGYQEDVGLTNWSMGFMEPNEWENYTRLVTNGAYNVYLRASAAPDVLMEVNASPTATSASQARAAMGTFAGVDTFDILSNYTFIPLKDFFSSNVVVRFSTNKPTTNTFRLTNIGGNGSYNWDYLVFVPLSTANTNVQRPYISAGYPYPGAGGVLPDQPVSFTIANRDTTVAPASVQLFVNGANVSSSLVFSNNSAGTVVTYTPSTLYELNTNSTVTAIFADTAGVYQTNSWQFSVADVLVIPPSYALASGSAVSNGFNLHIVKYPDIWPAGASPAPVSSVWAEDVLAGDILNTNTEQTVAPSTNVNYLETNTLNYELCGTNQPEGWYTFAGERAFPDISLAPYTDCAETNDTDGTPNGPDNFAMAGIFYVQLSPGLYQWAVRSDDGFRLATGTGAMPTNTVIMDYEGGRSAQNPSVFNFIVQTAGVYPMRLLYYQGAFGASLEFYSVDPISGNSVLINDPTSTNSIKVYQTSSANPLIDILDPQHKGSTTTFNFLTELGKTHTVQYKTSLTNSTWQTLTVVAGNGSVTNIVDATATNASRYYRVSTQ